MPRRFFLFFDLAFNNGIGIEKAKKAAFHFIDTQLQANDEIALISYSALKGLKLHEYLTTDHQKVRRILNRFGLGQIAGSAESFESEYWQVKAGVNPIDASRSGSVFDAKGLEPRQIREEIKLQARNFGQRLLDMAKALRYIPGNKYILFLSSGVPYSLVYGIQSPFGEIGVGEWGESWLIRKFEDVLKEMSSANCIIYALDTQEVGTTIGGDARTQGTFTLQKMTSATGGKYFANINNYEKHLQDIQDLTGCTYVLGYYVDDAQDGAYHKINIEVTRPGLRVHAQKGYFNPKPFGEYTGLERMLHLVDLALSQEPLFQTPVRFPLQVVPCLAESKKNLCLAAAVSVDKIREVLAGKSEFVVVIFDQNDNIVTLKRNEKETYSFDKEELAFEASFSLPPGKYKCRLVIRNLKTGLGAVASVTAVILDEEPSNDREILPLFEAVKR
jgi:VWFA-related protein